MERETTEESNRSHSYVIIVDEDVAAYIEQRRIIDANAFMNQLLAEEKKRMEARGRSAMEPRAQDPNELIAETPDTSGYKDIKDHFHAGTNR